MEKFKKFGCVTIFSLFLFSVLSTIPKYKVSKDSVAGRWDSFYVSEGYLQNHSFNKGTPVSVIIFKGNGTFEAKNLILSKNTIWSGKGEWRLTDKNSPYKDGTSVVSLVSFEKNAPEVVDCWIEIESSFFSTPKLIWRFAVNEGYEMKYRKFF